MITPSHLIYGWALARATETNENPTRTRAFVIGSFLPDVPTYLFFFVHTFFLGTAQQTMWDTLYFDSGWTPFITLSHSFLLWPLLFLVGKYFKLIILQWIASAAIIHTVLDFFVHHDDAYRHFWPLTDWTFMSPVSYWDPNYYGTIFSIADVVVVLLLIGWLCTRYQTRTARIWVLSIGMLYGLSFLLPFIIFA